MLLGNPHIECAGRKARAEKVKPRAIRHRGGYGDDLRVDLCLADERLGKNLGVAWRVGGGFLLLTRLDVEFRGGMPPVGAVFGVALALFRDRMDQHRPIGARLDGAQHGQKLLHVMPVDGADIGKAQLLKKRAADSCGFQQFLCPSRAFLKRFGQKGNGAFGCGLELLKRGARVKPRQVGGHGPRGWRDRHLVVVQDHDQPLAQMACVVHRLIGHAARERAIADYGNRIAMPGVASPAQIARHGKAKGRRDTCRRMGRAEGVIGRLGSLGETRQPIFLPDRVHLFASPGQDLVRIGLMADIPDQLVARRIENGMDRHRHLDHTQPRAEMPTRLADRPDGFRAQLIGKAAQLRIAHPLEVGRRGHAVEQRGRRAVGHWLGLLRPYLSRSTM